MPDWIEPIYDRTSADVTRAKLQVKEWIEAIGRGETVTIEDLKGFFNAVDLNRIENDTQYLALSSTLDLTVKTNWSRTGLPNQTDIERIISNINALIADFEFGEFTHEMPTTILTYKQANTVEHNLTIIKYLLEDMSARIQAEFTQIDATAEIEMTLCLTLPFSKEFDQMNVQLLSKAVNAGGVPIESSIDKMIISFTAPCVNSSSLPAPLETTIEFELISEVNNSDSNPIIAESPTEFEVSGKLINFDSNPITQELSLVKMDLAALYSILTPNTVKQLSDVTTDFVSEAIAHLLTTDEADMSVAIVGDIQSATFSFADMFIEAIFSSITAGLNSTIIKSISKKVDGTVVTTFATDITCGLYAYARLSTYSTSSLASMDGTTLKDLSYREL